MSEWIRNRKRTDGCPEGLIGKKVEARFRDGHTATGAAETFDACWNITDNEGFDILSYRVIEDKQDVADKTPYQQLCEKYGVAEDAEWITENNEFWESIVDGIIATIKHDDGTDAPIFYVNNMDADSFFIPIKSLRPYKDPAKISPKLWNAYKDVLNDEALAALRDVICNQFGKISGGTGDKAHDDYDIEYAFYWADTTQGHDFWADVYEGKYNKPTTALELQDAEIGIPAPVNEIVFNAGYKLTNERRSKLNDYGDKALTDIALGKSKYHKPCKGTVIDVYDVLVAFNVTCPAMAHAIKKMLMAGQRGAKDSIQDKEEAIASIKRSIKLENGK